MCSKKGLISLPEGRAYSNVSLYKFIKRAARNRREIGETCKDGFTFENGSYTECRDGLMLPAQSCPAGLTFDLQAEGGDYFELQSTYRQNVTPFE